MPRRRVDDKRKWKLKEHILALSYNKKDPFKEWKLLTSRPEKAEGKQIICACQYTGLQKYYEVRNDLGGRIYVGEGCIKYFPDYSKRKKKFNIAKKIIHGILNMKRGQYTVMDIFEYRNLITSRVKNFLANINIKELYSIKNPLNLGNYESKSIWYCETHYKKIQQDISHIEQKIPIINNAINDFVEHLQYLVDDIQCRHNIISALNECKCDAVKYLNNLKEDSIVLKNIIHKKLFTYIAETVAKIARSRAIMKEKEKQKKARLIKKLIERLIISKCFWIWYEKCESIINQREIKRLKEEADRKLQEWKKKQEEIQRRKEEKQRRAEEEQRHAEEKQRHAEEMQRRDQEEKKKQIEANKLREKKAKEARKKRAKEVEKKRAEEIEMQEKREKTRNIKLKSMTEAAKEKRNLSNEEKRVNNEKIRKKKLAYKEKQRLRREKKTISKN